MADTTTYVRCFGRDANGECGTGGVPLKSAASQNSNGIPLPPPVRAVSSGLYHALAVTASGELFSWGAGSGGQLGLPKTDNQNPFGESAVALIGTPTSVSGCGQTVVSIAAGRSPSPPPWAR